jgi:hypothetical protein
MYLIALNISHHQTQVLHNFRLCFLETQGTRGLIDIFSTPEGHRIPDMTSQGSISLPSEIRHNHSFHHFQRPKRRSEAISFGRWRWRLFGNYNQRMSEDRFLIAPVDVSGSQVLDFSPSLFIYLG